MSEVGGMFEVRYALYPCAWVQGYAPLYSGALTGPTRCGAGLTAKGFLTLGLRSAVTAMYSGDVAVPKSAPQPLYYQNFELSGCRIGRDINLLGIKKLS